MPHSADLPASGRSGRALGHIEPTSNNLLAKLPIVTGVNSLATGERSVCKQHSENIRIERQVHRLVLHWLDHGNAELVTIGLLKSTLEKFLGRKNATLRVDSLFSCAPVDFLLRSPCLPEVVVANQHPATISHCDSVDRDDALWEHASHLGSLTVLTDDLVANLEVANLAPARRREHWSADWRGFPCASRAPQGRRLVECHPKDGGLVYQSHVIDVLLGMLVVSRSRNGGALFLGEEVRVEDGQHDLVLLVLVFHVSPRTDASCPLVVSNWCVTHVGAGLGEGRARFTRKVCGHGKFSDRAHCVLGNELHARQGGFVSWTNRPAGAAARR